MFLPDGFDSVLLFCLFFHGFDELVGDVHGIIEVLVVDGDIICLRRDVERLFIVLDAAFGVVVAVAAGCDSREAFLGGGQNADGIDVHGVAVMSAHIGDAGRVNDIHVAVHHVVDAHAVEVIMVYRDVGHVSKFLKLYRVDEVIGVAFAGALFSGGVGLDLFEAVFFGQFFRYG